MEGFGQLARLPSDLRVLVLTHVEDIQDLFVFGRVNKGMKRWMHEKRVYAQWFKRQCGLPQGIEDSVVNQHVSHFLSRFERQSLTMKWNTGGKFFLCRFDTLHAVWDVPDATIRKQIGFSSRNGLLSFDENLFFRSFQLFMYMNAYYKVGPRQDDVYPGTFSCQHPLDVLCVSKLLFPAAHAVYTGEIDGLFVKLHTDQRRYDCFVWTVFKHLRSTVLLKCPHFFFRL